MEHLLSRRTGIGRRFGRATLRLAAAIRQMAARSRQRRALARLDDTLLRDIGLTRRDVVREVGKPFWRR